MRATCLNRSTVPREGASPDNSEHNYPEKNVEWQDSSDDRFEFSRIDEFCSF